jgi:hypothetical protein
MEMVRLTKILPNRLCQSKAIHRAEPGRWILADPARRQPSLANEDVRTGGSNPPPDPKPPVEIDPTPVSIPFASRSKTTISLPSAALDIAYTAPGASAAIDDVDTRKKERITTPNLIRFLFLMLYPPFISGYIATFGKKKSPKDHL